MTNRSIVLMLVAVLLLPLVALAQKSTTRFGFLAGGNSSNWSGADATLLAESLGSSSSPRSVFGYSIGAFIECRINKTFIFSPEIYYTNKGCKFSGTITYEDYYDTYQFDVDYLMKLNYIVVPALIKLAPQQKRQSDVFTVFAGPYLGFESGSIFKVKVNYQGESESDEEELPGIESTEWGAIVGAGVMFTSGLRITVQYQKGLSQVISDAEIKNTTISAVLGFAD